MRIFDPRNEHGKALITRVVADDTYATQESINTLIQGVEMECTFLSKEYACNYYTLKENADRTFVPKSFVYPFSAADLIPSSTKVTKNLTGNTITITTTDVTDVEKWSVYRTEIIFSDGTTTQALPDVKKESNVLTLTFGNNSRALDFSSVNVYLKRDGMNAFEEQTINH